jgi:hypothetical protein
MNAAAADPSFHPSAASVIESLKGRFPDTPFLALGQTVLWDEPTKAAFRRTLDALWPEARLIAAAHDTDYFAKLPGHPTNFGAGKYALVPHDDATTRGLWSAAGEMSRLWGSEDVPTRARLEKAGVSLHRATRDLDDPQAFLSEITAAWGWTGIIHTEPHERKIAHDIPLRDILPTLLEQIEWAVGGSVECIEGAGPAAHAREIGTTIRGWVQAFADAHPAASLTDLYRDLFPRFYALLLGAPAANLSTSNTLRLLRFNRETCRLPRFAFVDLFLRRETRREAIDAYNLAVAGGETYTLDRFGEGALPFDLVIPGRGRGTLCVREGDATVTVATEPPIRLCGSCDVADVGALADLVERELGADVALVGKAVSLIPMLAAEWALVFHEGASGYTPRTRQMTARLAEKGIPLPPLRPILRLRYHTWEALSAIPEGQTALRLPPHLAQAFGSPTIDAQEFGACWQCRCSHEQKRLDEIATKSAPRDLLAFLARTLDDEGWTARAREYEAARVRLLAVWDRAQAVQGRVYTLYDQVRRLKQEAAALEQAKGDDFRARVRPLHDRRQSLPSESDEAAALARQIDALQAERAVRFDREIQERRTQVRFALATVRELKAQRLALERGPEAADARHTLRRIEAEAERAKARLARNALVVTQGLPHTNYRPSSWWFPLVDPSGAWLRRLGATTEYYLEELTGPAAAAQ